MGLFLLVTTTLYACNISTKPDDKKAGTFQL